MSLRRDPWLGGSLPKNEKSLFAHLFSKGPSQNTDGSPRIWMDTRGYFSNFNCVPRPSWGHPAELKGHLTRSGKGTLGMISIASVASFLLNITTFGPFSPLEGYGRHVDRISSRRGATWCGPKVPPTKNQNFLRFGPAIFWVRAHSFLILFFL